MPLELAGPLATEPTGWDERDLSLPEGAQWLRPYVHSPFLSVASLLDRLLAPAVVVEGGWQGAVDLAARRPELVVVSREGDRCAAGIWRTGLHSSGVTGAALEEARAAVDQAAEAAQHAEEREQQARSELEEARAANSEAQKLVAAQAAKVQGASESLSRAGRDLGEAGLEADELSVQVAELRARRAHDGRRGAELEELRPGLEAAAAELTERALLERAARDRLVDRAGAVATLRRDFEVRASALEERRALLGRRLEQVEQRLAHTVAEPSRPQAGGNASKPPRAQWRGWARS